jgi:hypothetical protein
MPDLKEVGQIVFDAVPMLPDCTGGCSLREGENELLTILLQIKDYLNKELHLSIESPTIFPSDKWMLRWGIFKNMCETSTTRSLGAKHSLNVSIKYKYLQRMLRPYGNIEFVKIRQLDRLFVSSFQTLLACSWHIPPFRRGSVATSSK